MNIPIVKVGVIPFCDDPELGERRFLLHKPKPKNNATDDVPFGLCRGTRRYVEEGKMVDARDVTQLTPKQIASLEPYAHTAILEAEEELGLIGLTKERLIEMGPMHYYSERKDPYLIFWYATYVKDPQGIAAALDASATKWVRLQDLYPMIRKGEFKEGYLGVLERAIKLKAPGTPAAQVS